MRDFLYKMPFSDFLERRSKAKWYALKRRQVPTVTVALETIQQQWDQAHASSDSVNDSPIFLLAAQWRSGSTLVQRLINSDEQVLMWGEPYADCNLVQSLSASLRAFRGEQPDPSFFIDSDNFKGDAKGLAQRWTANLYPETAALQQAHRAFFSTLYSDPSKKRGFSRWGIKEVRLDMSHARYLRWLYPNAKFVFLYRDPYKAYRSCHKWRNLYMQWPDQGVDNATKFGQHWRTMVEGYRAGCDEVGGVLVKYEDFCQQKQQHVALLSDYLELELQADVLEKRIGSQNHKDEVPPAELRRLQAAVEPLASKLGYAPPKAASLV